MEQGTLTTPNRSSFDRLTGKAQFVEDGLAYGVDLGLIDMTAAEYGVEREKVMAAIAGNVVLAFEETVSVSPVWTLQGKQFHSQILPLLMLGTANADVVQSSGSGINVDISTPVAGGTYDLGYRNISALVVESDGDTLVSGVDYHADLAAGWIRIPLSGYSFTLSDGISCTFTKPAITRESITAFNRLNRDGTLKLLEFDNKSAIVKNEWSFPGSLTVENPGDTDPTKSKQWSMRFSLNGQPTLLRRKS